MAQQRIISVAADVGAVTAALMDTFLRNEIVEWTFTDDDGPVPVTEANIERLILSDFTFATPIADKAADLYTDAVLAPLQAAASKSSRRSPTGSSTSAPMASLSKHRRRRKPSSTPTTPTDDTAATSA